MAYANGLQPGSFARVAADHEEGCLCACRGYAGFNLILPGGTLKPPPRIRYEQQQQREQLQASGEHVEDQHELGKVGKHRKVSARADQRKAWADVVKRRRDCGKVGDKVEVIQRD